MNKKTTIQILRDFNEWRKDPDSTYADQPNTKCLWQAIDNAIATLFLRKMYDIPDNDYPDDIYFISNDPTGTLWYGDEFWNLDTMYETLLHNYKKEDVWNWYWYSLEHSGENRENYINLWHFVRKYPGCLLYTSDAADE